MTVEQLRNLYTARPFLPFLIHMADGRHLAVQHSEFLAFSPSGRTIVVYLPDESFHVVDLLLETDLEVNTTATHSRQAS